MRKFRQSRAERPIRFASRQATDPADAKRQKEVGLHRHDEAQAGPPPRGRRFGPRALRGRQPVEAGTHGLPRRVDPAPCVNRREPLL